MEILQGSTGIQSFTHVIANEKKLWKISADGFAVVEYLNTLLNFQLCDKCYDFERYPVLEP